MKKTIIALFALAGAAMADSTLTLVDQWEFSENWESTNGKEFSGSATQVTFNAPTVGIAKVRLYQQNSGWYLNDDNKISVGNNWAIQITMGVEDGAADSTSTYLRNLGGMFNTDKDGGAISLNITSATDPTIKTSYNDPTTITVPTDGTLQTYTLLQYGGKQYIAVDSTWAKFKLSDNTMKEYASYGNMKLENLTLGYRGDDNSSLSNNNTNQNVYMYLDDIKVYTFDTSASSLDVVKTALIPVAPAVPEPTAATLSLLALAGLAARRRRK